MLTVNTGDGMSTRQDRGFSIELEHNFQISISIIAFSEQLSNVFFFIILYWKGDESWWKSTFAVI